MAACSLWSAEHVGFPRGVRLWRSKLGSFARVLKSERRAKWLSWASLPDDRRRLAPLERREALIMGRSCAPMPDFVHGRDLARGA